MKKFIFALVALFAVAVTSVNAQEKIYAIQKSELHLSDGQSLSRDGITVTCDNGYMDAYNSWNASFTITTDEGIISQVIVNCCGYNASSGENWHKAGTGMFYFGDTDTVTGYLNLWDIQSFMIVVDK